MKYIDVEKLIKSVNNYQEGAKAVLNPIDGDADYYKGKIDACKDIQEFITSLQQKQQDNMIQWTGNNLKEVIDFTGKSPRFGEWFKSWEEYENYVHSHNDILKLFCEDGSHYEVPIGAWIVKTPDGYNVPSVAKYVKQEQPEVDLEEFDKDLAKLWGRCAAEPNDSIACLHIETFSEIARHFFELGRTRKEE